MATKVFLNKERAIPTGSRNIPVLEQLLFIILEETAKSSSKFNATERSLLIKSLELRVKRKTPLPISGNELQH